MRTPRLHFSRRATYALLGLVCLAACGEEASNAPAPPPPEVGYVVAHRESVPVALALPGRTVAYRISEVRPQVTGLVREVEFTQGAMVEEGQTLYQIDSRPYRAALSEARANLANARASHEAAESLAERHAAIVESGAVSQSEFISAVASERQTSAQIDLTSARLQRARLDLDFTEVPAPISGRIGRNLVTVGALVTADQPTPMAVIQTLDPIYVDIPRSSTEVLELRRALGSEGVVAASAEVRLEFQDQTTYEPAGTIEFTEAIVDPATGSVTLRARFPNPDGLLLPGMFVRARFAEQVIENAILVPQAALTRDAEGSAIVMVVAEGDVVQTREVVADRTSGPDWIVTSGLEEGDKVITQGRGRVRPDQEVHAVPESTPQQVGTETE